MKEATGHQPLATGVVSRYSNSVNLIAKEPEARGWWPEAIKR